MSCIHLNLRVLSAPRKKTEKAIKDYIVSIYGGRLTHPT